ncbi:Uncharacterised protein [Mycolicibacterium fortuitum]|uniref:Uncharacterized protein n=1 Tax=Mycolicibacterium fortuitum TaxID=1766 RepID=A0A378WFF2_MYCFO|nr:Uncharacterised protein [Mycolicibacterium fortuitum]
MSSPTSASDFSSDVELRSIQRADKTLLRFIPMLIVMAAAVLVLALLVLGLMFPRSPGLYYPLSVAIAIAVPAAMYLQKRKQLANDYGRHKRLILSPAGMRRTDANTIVDIPWSGIDRFQQENVSVAARSRTVILPVSGIVNAAKSMAHSTKALGIMGQGTVQAAPTASGRVLRMHDDLNGSELAKGQVRPTPNALIFPSEFENDWARGTIGAWIRHYRPDIPLDVFNGER